MKDRITTLIKALNFTAAQFADEIGVQKSGISHIISGRNKPSLDFIQKILSRFPEISMEWLLNGKGPMMKSDSSIQRTKESTLFTPGQEVLQAPDLFSTEIDHSRQVNSVSNTAVSQEILQFERDHEEPGTDIKFEMAEPGKAPAPAQESENSDRDTETIRVRACETLPRKIEKIVFFYDDKTFSEYFPS